MKNIIKKFLASSLVLASSGSLAEVNFIELSIAAWATEMEGGFDAPEYNDGTGYLVHTDNFDFETEISGQFLIRVENDNRYAPDVIAAVSSVVHSGPGTIFLDVDGDGIVDDYEVDDGEIDLSHAELTLFYSAFKNDLLDFNVGLTVKHFYGDFSLYVSNTELSSSLSTTLPMLFLGLDIEPASNLNLYAYLNAGQYQEQQGYDGTIGADYTFSNGVGLGIGYRALSTDQTSEIDEQGVNIDLDLELDVSGGFLRLYYHH